MRSINRTTLYTLLSGASIILIVSFCMFLPRRHNVITVHEWYYSLPEDNLYIVETFPSNSWNHVFQFSRTSSIFENHTDWDKYDALCTRSQLLSYYDSLPGLLDKLESEKVVSAPFFTCERIVWKKDSGIIDLVDFTPYYSSEIGMRIIGEPSHDSFGYSFLSIENRDSINEVCFSGNPSYPNYVSVEQMLGLLKNNEEMLVVFPEYSGMVAISQPNSTSFKIIEPDRVSIAYWNRKDESRFKHFLNVNMPIRGVD